MVPSGNLALVPFAVVSASILGSAHCVGMCGGLILAVAPTNISKTFYHLGRGLGYTLLGFLAGYLGKKAFDSDGFLLLTWFGICFMSFGLVFLGVQRIVSPDSHPGISSLHSKLVHSIMARLIRYRAYYHGVFVLGWLSSLIPCSWLYSFVLAAAALGDPKKGALALFAFWLGTLPALGLGTYFVQKFIRPIGLFSPRISGILLVLAGFATLYLRSVPFISNPMGQERTVINQLNCLFHARKDGRTHQ